MFGMSLYLTHWLVISSERSFSHVYNRTCTCTLYNEHVKG